MPQIYVGTSGWTYDWNEGGSFDWYSSYSGLNAVELNASFYRFPFPSQISGWRKKGANMRWSVKVNRLITHIRRLSPLSLQTWEKFRRLFTAMDEVIDFFLFQMPPNFSCNREALEKIEFFEKSAKLGNRMAIEFRNSSCFNEEVVNWVEKIGITLVSVDSPQISWFIKTGKIIYVRLHGRSDWYIHRYTEKELEEIAEKSLSLHPEKLYVFFNNDHWMLDNARMLLEILRKKT